MTTIKKRLVALVAGIVAVLGIGLAMPGVASANVYWNTSTCNHSAYTKYICFDYSAGTTVIRNGSSYTYYTTTVDTSLSMTAGYIAFDQYECNANANQETYFTTSGQYGVPSTVVWTDGPAFGPGVLHVSTADKNVIAWLANTNSGYPCFIVP